MNAVQEIREQLLSLADEKYRNFCSSLMPTIEVCRVIGVRTPVLRAYAKRLFRQNGIKPFLEALPHHYYEENNLHAFLIEQIADFDECIFALERFLPYVDNWATCDSMVPAVLKKHADELLPLIRKWLESDHIYTVRYSIGLLMRYYLDDRFDEKYPLWIAEIRSEEYYVNMMIAWYFATALAKQPATILPYITEKRLPTWIHNKTIQKAVESYRISDDLKFLLRTYRIKIK